MAAIECVRFRSHEKGFLMGFATLFVEKWGIEIDGFTMWQKEGKRWINMPSNEYTDKETGEKKYKSVFHFKNKEHFTMFLEAARVAIDEYIAKMAEVPAQPEISSEDSEGVPF